MKTRLKDMKPEMTQMTPHQEALSKCHPTNYRQVNNFIKGIKGTDPGLVNGDGYFYFSSLIGDCAETSVYVNSVKQMSYGEWLSEYERLLETKI